MCEFVIKRIDATHSDATKNVRGCYKRGDIIDILDDGLADTMPHLTVIKVPGLDKNTVLAYMESIRGTGPEGEDVVSIRRKFRIPPNVMNQLFPNDTVTQYTVNLSQWNGWKSKIEEKTI